MELLTYDLVRAEDLDLGDGTVEVRLQDQSVITMHRINLASLLTPLTYVLRASDSQDGGLTVRIVGARPKGCRTWWVTLQVRETFGSSLGLESLALGDDTDLGGWGQAIPPTAETTCGQGHYGGRGDLPVSYEDEDLVLTALGGRFDTTGMAQVCVHVSWLDYPETPRPWQGGQANGTSGWPLATTDLAGVVELSTVQETFDGLRDDLAVTPASLQAKWDSEPPGTQPASETQAGVTRYGTPAETVPGVLTTVATHPAGVKAALDAGLAAKVPNGPALSVPRYAASGQALEPSPLTVNATGYLGIGTPTPLNALHIVGETIQAAGATQDMYLNSGSGVTQGARKARGTLAAPLKVPAGDTLLSFQASAWARDLADTTDTFFTAARLQLQTDSADAQGRIGSRLALHLAPGAGQPITEVLRVTEKGNALLGLTTHGTGLSKGVVVAEGVAPSAAHPADAVQVWVENLEGVAGAGALHVRSETGVLTRIGSGVLSRKMVLTSTTATVAAPYVITAEESGKVFIANNATERCQFTLPAPVVGLTYTFVNTPAQGMRIRTSGTGRIRLGGTLTIVGGALDTVTVGDTLILVVISTVIWQAIGAVQGFTIVA